MTGKPSRAVLRGRGHREVPKLPGGVSDTRTHFSYRINMQTDTNLFYRFRTLFDHKVNEGQCNN
jgi:hypothetical protein